LENDMSASPDQPVRPEVFLDALLYEQTQVAGDVIEVGPHTWAIHGVIPVDGDVIIGEFDSPQDAHAALAQLALADEPRP
jgi:hypothetical protein